jgi:hypothetical protein
MSPSFLPNIYGHGNQDFIVNTLHGKKCDVECSGICSENKRLQLFRQCLSSFCNQNKCLENDKACCESLSFTQEENFSSDESTDENVSIIKVEKLQGYTCKGKKKVTFNVKNGSTCSQTSNKEKTCMKDRLKHWRTGVRNRSMMRQLSSMSCLSSDDDDESDIPIACTSGVRTRSMMRQVSDLRYFSFDKESDTPIASRTRLQEKKKEYMKKISLMKKH